MDGCRLEDVPTTEYSGFGERLILCLIVRNSNHDVIIHDELKHNDLATTASLSAESAGLENRPVHPSIDTFNMFPRIADALSLGLLWHSTGVLRCKPHGQSAPFPEY